MKLARPQIWKGLPPKQSFVMISRQFHEEILKWDKMVSKRSKNSASKSQNEEFHDDREEFDKLCRELNMDIETADAAWNSYTDVKDKYTLEVRFHNSKTKRI